MKKTRAYLGTGAHEVVRESRDDGTFRVALENLDMFGHGKTPYEAAENLADQLVALAALLRGLES